MTQLLETSIDVFNFYNYHQWENIKSELRAIILSKKIDSIERWVTHNIHLPPPEMLTLKNRIIISLVKHYPKYYIHQNSKIEDDENLLENCTREIIGLI